jgi:hypothetical protein
MFSRSLSSGFTLMETTSSLILTHILPTGTLSLARRSSEPLAAPRSHFR